MKKHLVIGFLTFFYLAEVLITYFGISIYLSYLNYLPWYEKSGQQGLANLIIAAPILVIIGVIIFAIGRKLSVPRIIFLLPWVAICFLNIPFLFGVQNPVIYTGIVLSSIVLLAQLIFNAKDIWRLLKSKDQSLWNQ